MEKSIKELIKRDTPAEVYTKNGWFICPSCNEITGGGDFCRFCGQRLSYNKWFKEKYNSGERKEI